MVQRTGLGWTSCRSIRLSMVTRSSPALRWTLRRGCLSVRVAKRRSTGFSHEELVGVRCTCQRGRLASRSRTRLVSQVASLSAKSRGLARHHKGQVEVLGHLGLDPVEKAAELGRTMARIAFANDAPRRDVACGGQACGAVAGGVVAARAGWPGRMGWLRSSAWVRLSSSKHSTSARSGGAMWRPTTSRTLATTSRANAARFAGPVEGLNVSIRCGAKPNARHTRCTVDIDRPLAAAMPRELQRAASGGTRSRVAVITASMRASSAVRGAPGRGSSRKPSNRCSAKRRRHLLTVCLLTPRRAATSWFCAPSAQASARRARNAVACAVERRAARACNSVRSASANANARRSALARPVLSRAKPTRRAASSLPRTSGPIH